MSVRFSVGVRSTFGGMEQLQSIFVYFFSTRFPFLVFPLFQFFPIPSALFIPAVKTLAFSSRGGERVLKAHVPSVVCVSQAASGSVLPHVGSGLLSGDPLL